MGEKKTALSLTEVLIVLVIVAILFAAVAPVFTKKVKNDTLGNEFIWNYVTFDDNYDSFFDPGIREWTSSVYVNSDFPANGVMDPNAGKLVITAKDINASTKQHQIQFRYTDRNENKSYGLNTANLLFQGFNLVLGPDSNNLNMNSASGSTIAGLHTLGTNAEIFTATVFGDSAIGYSASNRISSDIAIGAHAGNNRYRKTTYENSIAVGTYSGLGNHSVAIGYSANSIDSDSDRENNIYIGAETGAMKGNNNILIGASKVIGSNTNSTIIGYGSINILPKEDWSLTTATAIGYNTCNVITEISGNSSGKSTNVCIGHNSGSTYNGSRSDEYIDGEHIYIGGTPLPTGSFGGRSVLEVHRLSSLSTGDKANVVLNSNLVVRGNIYNRSVNINQNSVDLDNFFILSRENAGYVGVKTCNSDSYNNQMFANVATHTKGFVCRTVGDYDYLTQNAMGMESSCTIGNSGCPRLSDKRLKNILSENNEGLDKVLKIKPYSYLFKSDKFKNPQVGVIAQDLQNIFPNSVITDNNGYLKIRWDEMFYSLINAIKELDKKVKTIAMQINSIKTDITQVKNEQKNVRQKLSELNARVTRLEKKVTE